MFKNYWWALAISTTSIFLGYCYYFDCKRRSQPDYKMKLHMRRQESLKEKQFPRGNVDTQHVILEPTDHNTLEHCFLTEIKLGELLISSGKLSEGLGHLANAIMICAQPIPVLQTLKDTLPDGLFRPLILKLQDLQELQLAHASQTTTSSLTESVGM